MTSITRGTIRQRNPIQVKTRLPHQRPPPVNARPRFFSLAMWFVWLLRVDVRGRAKSHDTVAQHEFVVWWLLHGRAEYPAVWHWADPQAKIAMELVQVGDGFYAHVCSTTFTNGSLICARHSRWATRMAWQIYFVGIVCVAPWNSRCSSVAKIMHRNHGTARRMPDGR